MHYVYELRDPRNGKAFYVGKGHGDRAYQHQREVQRGRARSNPAKVRKIVEILNARLQVEVAIIAEYEFEEDALDHEFHRIEEDPTLTNMRPGGCGGGIISILTVVDARYRRIKKLYEYLVRIRKQMLVRTPKLGMTRREKFKLKCILENDLSGDCTIQLNSRGKLSGKDRQPSQVEKKRFDNLDIRILCAQKIMIEADRLCRQLRREYQLKRAKVV